MSADVQQQGLCESAHRITASVEGVEPLVITLPYPILSIFRFKATQNPIGKTTDLVLVKALDDHWPGDLIHQKQLAWNADRDLKPWTDVEKNEFFLRFPVLEKTD